jgi:hypothetical protein
MKKLSTFAVLAAGLSLAVSSCTKDETTTTPPTTPPTTTPTAPPPPQPTITGANGALIALQMDFSYDAAGFPVTLNTEMGIAAFYNSTGNSATLVDGGNVTVNSIALTKNANNSYLVTAGIPTQEPSTLNLDGNIAWNVAGSSNVPAFSYNIDASTYPFVDYTGTIPTDITKANGLVLNFTAANTKNADSVYVMIISGSTSFLKAYKGNAGNINITASELNGLTASSSTSPAYIEIVPWKVLGWVNPMGKVYAIVNERAIVKTINLN